MTTRTMTTLFERLSAAYRLGADDAKAGRAKRKRAELQGEPHGYTLQEQNRYFDGFNYTAAREPVRRERPARIGERAACKHCGQEIEFSGRHPSDWTDRGGNRACCTFIRNGEAVRPTTQHEPTP